MCIQMASIFLFSILLCRFRSRGLDNFLPFSAPNSVGYFVEQKKCGVYQPRTNYLTMTYLFS